MRHIYVHVPFCARRCVYCDFAIAVRRRIPGERFVRSVQRELQARLDAGSWDREPIETLYLGGGTPSLVPAPQLAELVRFLLDRGGGSRRDDAEVTLEANPDDVTSETVRVWADAGVNRISLGAQSFDDEVLRWMHRTHDSSACHRAVALARDAGIAAVSLDIIFALPESLSHALEADLETAVQLEPEHLSVYGLTVEPRTPLARWVEQGVSRPAPATRYEREFLLVDRLLTAAGFEHYEISNYARHNHRARHNAAYWSGRPYGGLGPSAHSFLQGERRWNEREWVRYEPAVEQRGDPVAGSEMLSAEQRRLEHLFLGLRTVEGVEAEAVTAWPQWQAAVDAGWLVVSRERARLTPQGWLLIEALIPRLTTSASGG